MRQRYDGLKYMALYSFTYAASKIHVLSLRVTFLPYLAHCSQKKCPLFTLLTFDGEDSAGADSGRLRGGTGGGT